MNSSRSKKKRFFSSNQMARKRRDLFVKTGLKGFICTCNGNEKQCIREAYNILNEYADKLYGEEMVSNSNPKVADASNPPDTNAAMEEDELDEFEKQVDTLKSELQNKTRRFQALDTGILNCIFIQTHLNDPVGLANSIMKDLFETKLKKNRFLLRMVPIAITCRVYMDDLERVAGPLFDEHFKSEPTTYAIVYSKRCNSNLQRDDVIQKLASMVQERNAEHKVNLTNPATAIVVDVMKNICGLSVIPDYYQLSKYNLNSLCGSEEDGDKKAMEIQGDATVEKETNETGSGDVVEKDEEME